MANELTLMKNSALFKDMAEEVIQKFLDVATTKSYTKDELLYVEMQENDDISFILEGEIRAEVTVHQDASGIDLGAGEFLGLVKFVQSDTPVALLTATAKADTRVLRWQASQWREICDQDTQTGYTLALRIGKILFDRMVRWHMHVLNTASWGIE